MGRPFDGLEPVAIDPADRIAVPERFAALIADARARAQRFVDARGAAGRSIASFAHGDGGIAWRVIAQAVDRALARGRRFCEWGSGFGVATCAAAQLGLDAVGIELDAALADEARRLAADHAVPARFVTGSYRPAGTATERIDRAALDRELGFSPVDFDFIYVYPWPAEERLVDYLFRHFAPAGALLAVYRGGSQVALWRKPG